MIARITGPQGLRSFLLVAMPALCTFWVACAGAASDDEKAEPHEHEPVLAESSYALSPNDPVSAAVTSSCSTTSVRGLATQLVAEIQCLRPGTLKSIAGVSGYSLGPAVFPFLQTPAADALARVQRARGRTLVINSALRTVPQQFLLYRWYQTKRCGISLAAEPGKSNHEAALAVDVDSADAWRSAFSGQQYRWLGARDPVHFDYVGPGGVDIRGLSVRAFQRLWNRNNPNDRIAEDGDYGDETASRLAKSPVGGFAKGANCSDVGDAGVRDAGRRDAGDAGDAGDDDLPPFVPSEEPDSPGEEEQADGGVGDAGSPSASGTEEGSGCSCSAPIATSRPATWSSFGSTFVLIAMACALRLRRRQGRIS
jgi:D-alanyl-D-alanine dipeptidase